MEDFAESRPGQAGKFTGTGPSFLPGNPNGEGGTATFTVTNSVSHSRKWLTDYDNQVRKALGLPLNRELLLGLTSPDTPLRNYTGSDIADPMQMLMTQIHELGHSLDAITKIGYDDINKHPGSDDLGGTILEDCVRKRGGFKWR